MELGLIVKKNLSEDDQLGAFQNATFFGHGDFCISIAVESQIPKHIQSQEEIADYLSGLLSPLARQGCKIEVQIGGWD